MRHWLRGMDASGLVYQDWPHIPVYAGGIALVPFHSASHTDAQTYRIASLVWRCLSGWAPSYLHELYRPLSSTVQAAPPYAAVRSLQRFGGSIRPLCKECRAVPFLWSVQQPGSGFPRSEAPPKWSLFSVSPTFEDFSFPLGLGRERLWVGILTWRWLIDW